MSGLKDYAGFNDSGGADQEYKLPSPGYHVVEVTEGTKIFEAGEYQKINIPIVCSEGDVNAGMKFNIQLFLEGGEYDTESDARKVARILYATQTDDKFLAGFAKEERSKKIGMLITDTNFKKILDPAVAPYAVNAINILLPGIQFGAKLRIYSKGEYSNVIFDKIAIKGSPAFKEMFADSDTDSDDAVNTTPEVSVATEGAEEAAEGWQ